MTTHIIIVLPRSFPPCSLLNIECVTTILFFICLHSDQQNRHEDEEAVVTVVTREDDSDDNSDDEDDLFAELDEIDANDHSLASTTANMRQGAASTPFNPSAKQQQSALQKAKLAIKQKDKASKRGIKGGHKYKKPKIQSKKKKIKFGNKKGANRDK